MRGEYAISQTDVIPQPPRELLKSIANTLLVLPVGRFNELGQHCTPRVVLLLMGDSNERPHQPNWNLAAQCDPPEHPGRVAIDNGRLLRQTSPNTADCIRVR
jgi:hypothetical protein